ncbi:MAG: radical SAM protein [Nitrospirae bacterium]|nr:radical SAM protein [Nitrospirota bacterium]
MWVSEIFTSIQGESTHAGRPCTFVRTSGCDQRCAWCDTAYAFHGGTEYTLDALHRAVAAAGVKLVEVTGGEPLLQADTPPFLAGLCDRGYEVLLETGGSLPIAGIDPRVKRIVDFKPPSSGMTDLIHWENIGHLKAGDEAKFVIANRADYEWSRDVAAAHALAGRVPVLFSPAFGLQDPATLAEWIIADGLAARLQLQVHKVIWSPSARGV